MDTWMIFDNSGTKPELMAQQTGGKTEILNKELYAVMEKMR
jgi:predicted ABC-type ATPase